MPKPTRIVYSILLYTYHGRSTLRYCEAKDELARFLSAADKTPLQRLSYMSCRPPLTLADFGVFDGAKIQLFSKLDKKSLPLPVLGAKAIKIFSLFASLNTRSPHKAFSFSTGRLLYLCYSILFSSANRCNKGFILGISSITTSHTASGTML